MPKYSVRKPLTIFVAVLAVIILGVVAFTRMTPDLLPNMDFPYVIIMTTYPGQSPEVVEEEITRPLEQSMATLDHIKEVTSTSQENYSLVALEFEESVNRVQIGHGYHPAFRLSGRDDRAQAGGCDGRGAGERQRLHLPAGERGHQPG